ncbi:unnamed protein product [marine sediment metagenome]|uniref:Uncharacterized protein n=1 Tax=marine sediment metagenome TaxID=412755 RepID=X1LJA5_9ZZZZ
MADKRIKPECLEWDADGTCVKFRFTEEEGMVADLKACKLKDKEKIIKEIKRGFKVEE